MSEEGDEEAVDDDALAAEWESSVAAEDEDAGRGEHAAVPEHDADLGSWHLRGRLAADLAHGLLDGEHPIHAGVRV